MGDVQKVSANYHFSLHVSFPTVCALLIAIYLQVLEEDVLLAASQGDRYLFEMMHNCSLTNLIEKRIS